MDSTRKSLVYSGTSISRSRWGPARFVRQVEGSLYPGSFSYILLLLGQRTPFVISRFSLNRGSLNRDFTV